MKRGQIIIGLVFIAIGFILLLGRILGVDLWRIIWPLLLISLGVWLLFRPRFVGPGKGAHFNLLGEVKRRGNWKVQDEEIWNVVGDVELDMTQADIPLGNTTIHIYGFVGDVKIYFPRDTGVSLHANAFVGDAHIFGNKQTGFLTPIEYQDDQYASTERNVLIETSYFVHSLNLYRR